MNTYWPVRPRNTSRSCATSSAVKATKLTTASNSSPCTAARTDSGSRALPWRACTPSSSGRAVLRPRFSTQTSNPFARARSTHDQLRRPVPPMKRILRAVISLAARQDRCIAVERLVGRHVAVEVLADEVDDRTHLVRRDDERRVAHDVG